MYFIYRQFVQGKNFSDTILDDSDKGTIVNMNMTQCLMKRPINT